MAQTPLRMPKEELIDHLERILQAVKEDDSFEGNITYTTIGDHFEDLGPEEFEVHGVYRVGNSMGQGGVCVLWDVS